MQKITKKHQGEVTRKQILDVTARRFAQHGYEGISLEAIAQEVGVAKSSVLWHFGSKDLLLYEVIRVALGAWKKERNEQIAVIADPKERLLEILQGWRRLASEHPDTLLLMLTVMLNTIDSNAEISGKFREMWRGYREEIASAIEFGMQQGVFRRDLSPEEVAAVIMGAFQGLFVEWYLERDSGELMRALDSLGKWVVKWLSPHPVATSEKAVSAPGPTN